MRKMRIQRMNRKGMRRIAAIVVLSLGLSQVSVPVWAASTNVVSETANQTELTVSQIKELAVIYNPTNKTYQLNQDNLELNRTTTSNSLRSARNGLNSSEYDVDTSNLQALRAQIETLKQQNQTTEVKNQIASLEQQLAQAESSVNAAYSTVESKLDAAVSTIEQLSDTLDNYEDEQDDLDKTVEDWKTQVRLIAEVLCYQTIQYDKNMEILEEQITLAETALKLAEVQQELGMVLTMDVTVSQTSLAEAEQSLETLKENKNKLLRQINVLIGRDQNSELQVKESSIPVIVSDVPIYSETLLKEITDADYTLKTYERTIANYKDDADDETDSDVLQSIDNKIASVKLATEERKRSLKDSVKTQLAKMNADKASYETSQKKVVTEKKQYEMAQKKQELGLITGSELLEAEINYQNAMLNHWNSMYNYYLDWQEYKAMKDGIDLTSYSGYRM